MQFEMKLTFTFWKPEKKGTTKSIGRLEKTSMPFPLIWILNHDFGVALPDEAFQDDLGLPSANCGEESARTGVGKGLGESGQVEIFDNK